MATIYQVKHQPDGSWRDVSREEYEDLGGHEKRVVRATDPAPAEAKGEFDATFAEWLATEMPAGTVIGNPKWWAERIARQYRVRCTPQPAGGEAVAIYQYRDAYGGWHDTNKEYHDKYALDRRIVYTTPQAAQVQQDADYRPIRLGGIRRPSDAALAAAFWEHRQRENSLPVDLCDSKLVSFGNEIVRRARELAPHVDTHPAAGDKVRELRKLVRRWRGRAQSNIERAHLGDGYRIAGNNINACADDLEAALAQPQEVERGIQ